MPKRAREDRRTFAMLVAGLVILALVAVLTWQAFARTRASVEWVDHTHDVLDGIAETVEGLGRAEAARRAYSLTGDADEVVRFDAADNDVHARLATLVSLVGDNPTQIDRTKRFSEAAKVQLDLQRSALTEKQLTRERARAVSLALTQSSLRSRSLANDMMLEERNLLEVRERERATFERQSIATIAVGAGVFAFLLALSYVRLVREIKARRRGERDEHEARERAEALVKELESFSYAVAHDLRTPLRGIDGFSKAVLDDYGDRIDEDGRKNLERVRRATHRMSELIEDLLRLSNITRAGMSVEEVDLAEIARECVTELARIEPDRDVQVELPSSLPARGDRRLLKVLLENLLGNAWKFTSQRTEARVEVGEDDRTYFVRDNGVGFEMKYASKLFGAFQRMHDARDFPGSGIGLATAQRIVHRHGGKIWAESETDRGTTFHFTLQGIS